MRMIDADALIVALKRKAPISDAMRVMWAECLEEVRHAPTIEPERKKGKWIMKYKGSAVTSYKCSECGRTVKDDTGYDVSKDYPFCHCGADMREGAEQE